MAYLKVLPVVTNTHLNNLIKYITRVDKTDGRVFVSAAGCRVETAIKDFKKIREISGKQRGLVAHQLVRSFPAGEVDPEQAQQMAEELAARMLPGHQYIVCTHVDRDHIHTHIVFNSVSYLTGEKYHNNKKSLRIMRGGKRQSLPEVRAFRNSAKRPQRAGPANTGGSAAGRQLEGAVGHYS